MSATCILAEYTATARYADLPANVVLHSKRVIRDAIGCMLGGSTLDEAVSLRHVMMDMAADGAATVVGASRRLPPPIAAYINAQEANLMDFDDTLQGRALGHPGATVVPAALSLAEANKATGKEFLNAVSVGYDVYTRVAAAGRPSYLRTKQVRGLATWQGVSTVAAAANLMHLDAETTARAFGLTILHAVVPPTAKFYDERPVWGLKNNFGWVVMGGLLGAQYASQGMPCNHDMFDGPTGFWAMAGSDQCDESLLTAELGCEHSILDVSIKPYASCRHTHHLLDGLGTILQRTGIGAEEVKSVRLCGDSKLKVFADYRPRWFVDAEFSLPYLVAITLLRKPTGYAWFDGEPWKDPRVQELSDRVHFEEYAEAEAAHSKGLTLAHVIVETNDGRLEQASTGLARGHPENPMSDEELRGKFIGLAERPLGLKRAEELDALLMRLEDVQDISEVTRFLAV